MGNHPRPKILSLNGFDYYQESEASGARILEGLLKESESSFGHGRTIKDSDDKALIRYFYVHDLGTSSSSGSKKDKSWEQQANPGAKAIKNIVSEHGAVKFENPEHLTMAGRLKVLKDGKTALTKKQNELKDRAAQFAAVDCEPHKKSKTTLEAACKNLEKIVDQARALIVTGEAIKPDAEKETCATATVDIDALIKQIDFHRDAATTILKVHKLG